MDEMDNCGGSRSSLTITPMQYVLKGGLPGVSQFLAELEGGLWLLNKKGKKEKRVKPLRQHPSLSAETVKCRGKIIA